jgi:hypothetical protein
VATGSSWSAVGLAESAFLPEAPVGLSKQVDKERLILRDATLDFSSTYILLACVELERQIWGAASIKRGNMLNTAV